MRAKGRNLHIQCSISSGPGFLKSNKNAYSGTYVYYESVLRKTVYIYVQYMKVKAHWLIPICV